MPVDIAQVLRRKSRPPGGSAAPACASCRRTPVPGEVLHVLGGGRSLCALCVSSLPEDERREARRERVHARERHVAIVPRAA